MRILFLTDNFPPEVNAPANRTFEHCREWARAGHAVTVVTGVPNFPAGKVFAGYRNRLWQTERIDGVRVIRVWTYIAANAGFGRRVLDYLSFMLAAILAAPFAGRADVVIATSPQFFTACAGWVVSLLKRTPFVFELRDLWPASIRAVGAVREGPMLRGLEALELFLYRRAAAIVSVTGSFREDLVRRGIDPGKIEIVTNGVDRAHFFPRAKNPALVDRLGLADCFVAGYVGTIGMAHGLETVLEAAAIMQRRPGGDDVRFLLLGDGAARPSLEARAASMGLGNLTFLDPVPRDRVPDYLAVLDAAVIHLRDEPLFRTVIPSKLFECMAMGIPVLHGVPGESAEIVEREGVGICFGSGDSEALCAAIETLRSRPNLAKTLAGNGIAAAGRYERTALAARLLACLETVAGATGAGAMARRVES